MKRKILLSFLSFVMIALFSCGLIFLPLNTQKNQQTIEVGQEETQAVSGNWDDYASTAGFSVSGTTIRISTAEGLAYFSKNIATYANYTVIQQNNIDLSAHYWTPIGYDYDYRFTGSYDGQGYAIDGLYSRTDLSIGGFFGYINGATLNGIIVRSGEINVSSGTAGGICANGDGGFTISNCANYANINGKHVGGILGSMQMVFGLNESDYDSSSIYDCYNRGNLTSSSSTSWASYVHIGGIAGNVRKFYNSETNQIGSVGIRRCYNTGNISYTGTATNYVIMGGILGYHSMGAMGLYCCFNLGAVTCSSTVTDQSDINAVVGQTAPSETPLGAIASIGTTYWGVNCNLTYVARNQTTSTMQAQDEDCRQISGFDAAAKLSSTFLSGRYFTINGTQYGWGLVAEERWTYNNNWEMSSDYNDGYLYLTIDKNDQSTLSIDANGGTYNGTSSISYTQYIGTTRSISAPSRTGYSLGAWVLDGGGTISTFGKLHEKSLDPFFMDGTNSTSVYNNSSNGTVTHQYIASSNVDIELPTGARILRVTNTGSASPGLGGFTNYLGTRANAVFYTIIYAKIPVGYNINSAENAYGGGTKTWLTSQAGTGDWQVYIHRYNCGSSGTFRDVNYYYLSGTAGTTSNPVVWDVAYFGTYDATGLSTSGSSTTTLTYTYDASNNSLVALWNINSYTLTVNPNGGTWSGSTSNQTFTQKYLTTKEIAEPTRTGYIFNGWALSGSGSFSGTTFTYGAGNATLRANWIETWAVNYTIPSGSGTEEDPYKVDSASDLAYFAYKTQILGEQCYDHIVLTRDIDLAGYDWMPIGTGRNVVSGVQPYFRGIFDGQGHSISNLNINVEGYQELNEYGLFGLIDVDAVLKNFTILSGEVNGSAKVGGAVGWLWSASVENVINYANINGSSYVGGIVGNYHSWEGNFVRECQNYGTITGTNYTAGIVGGGDDSSGMQNIVDCVNYGTIKGASFTGGIVGNIVKVKMSGCVNYGSISGQDRVGGIAGRVNNNSVVSELVNYGDVTGWTHVAGILGGAAYADSATSCFNLGNIKGESHIGGVIGYVYDGITLTNSANFGNITGTNTEVGGLIGLVESSSAGAVIRNNGSEGSLVGTGATNVGTLIGRITGSNVVENNYANMTTTSNTFIGAGSVNGAYIYVLNVNGTTYKRYHGDVSNFGWVSGSDCPIPKGFSWVGEYIASVTTSNLTSAGFTSI